MNPQTLARLQKNRDDTKPANWVEVSADDVLEAVAAIADPADKIMALLQGAAEHVIQGRVMPRRGPPPRRPIVVHRKDLEHLLTRLTDARPSIVGEQPVPLQQEPQTLMVQTGQPVAEPEEENEARE